MEVIRRSVFETNSSSTHSLTMCSEQEYDKWKSGEVMLRDDYSRKDNESQFITKEEAIKIKNLADDPDYKEAIESDDQEAIEEILKENEIYTFENFFRDDMEDFESTYTTKTGEKIMAFGYYGHD